LNVKEKIQEVSLILDELDDYKDSLSLKLSEMDLRKSDLYHYLELMSLDSKKCYRFCKELKKVLLQRRKIKEDFAVMKHFEEQKTKLINGRENRQLLVNSVFKHYKNIVKIGESKVYTEEELKELIGG